MSFNIKQIKNIKFLLIIFVILLLFFIAYLFLGKKTREYYDPEDERYGGGSYWLNPPPSSPPSTPPSAPPSSPPSTPPSAPPSTPPSAPPSSPPSAPSGIGRYDWTAWIANNHADPEDRVAIWGNAGFDFSESVTNQPSPAPGSTQAPAPPPLVTGYIGGMGPERCTAAGPPYGWAMTQQAAMNSYPGVFVSSRGTLNQLVRDPTCGNTSGNSGNTSGNSGNTSGNSGNTSGNSGNTGGAQIAELQAALTLAQSQADAARVQLTTLQASNSTNATTLSTAQANLAAALKKVAEAEAAAASATGRPYGVPGASVYLYPGSSQSNYPNYSLYNNNNLLQQQQRLFEQTQSQLQQSQQSQQSQQQTNSNNNIRGASSEKKNKICYAPYKNEKDCENAGYIWNNDKEKCRKPNMNKCLLNEFKELRKKVNSLFNSNNDNDSNLGNDDKYILKTQIVPPVCPACPSYKCGVSEPQKIDNSMLDDATNNDLLNANNMILNERNFAKNMKPKNEFNTMPMPLLADFSQFM